MKKYYKPKMNVTAFDSDEMIVTSGSIKEWENEYKNNSQTIQFSEMTKLSNYASMSE